jgi:hypothetical protein
MNNGAPVMHMGPLNFCDAAPLIAVVDVSVVNDVPQIRGDPLYIAFIAAAVYIMPPHIALTPEAIAFVVTTIGSAAKAEKGDPHAIQTYGIVRLNGKGSMSVVACPRHEAGAEIAARS